MSLFVCIYKSNIIKQKDQSHRSWLITVSLFTTRAGDFVNCVLRFAAFVTVFSMFTSANSISPFKIWCIPMNYMMIPWFSDVFGLTDFGFFGSGNQTERNELDANLARFFFIYSQFLAIFHANFKVLQHIMS